MALESQTLKELPDDEPLPIDKCAFSLCGLGLNITFAIYLAYVQVYGETFSRTIMGRMNIAIYSAATTVVLTQMYLDPFFDKKYTPKLSYTFRICLTLVVVFFTLISIPFADNNIHHVYLVGIFIGLFEGSGLTTVQQLASAVHPDLTKHVNTGFTVAQVLPILLSLMLGFYSARAGSFAAIAFAWIPACLCLAACALYLALVLSGNFNRAFAQMEQNSLAESEQTPLISERKDSTDSGGSTVLSTSSGEGGNIWLRTPVLLCASVQFMTNGFSMFLMPFLTYFGGSDLAHILVLVRFGSELVGRILSHFWGFDWWNLDSFQAITVLVVSTVIRGILLVAVLLDAFGVYELGLVWLFFFVGMFYLTFGWSQSEVMTIIVKVGPKRSNSELTRGMMFLCFAAQLLSLAVAVILVEFYLEAEAPQRSVVVH